MERAIIIKGNENVEAVEARINQYLEHGWEVKFVVSQRVVGEFNVQGNWLFIIKKDDFIVKPS
jgi:hypothetical protein